MQGTTMPAGGSGKTVTSEGNQVGKLSNVSYTATNTSFEISYDYDAAAATGLTPATQARVGVLPYADQPIAADVTSDFLGQQFGDDDIAAGPFADAKTSGTVTKTLWPPAGQTVPTPPAPPAGTPENLALLPDAVATASCSDTQSGYLPPLAIDGNGATRWGNDRCANRPTGWFQVDLGARYRLDSLMISWEGAYARGFIIQLSDDGTEFTDVYTTANGTGGVQSVNLGHAEGRYVRIQGVTAATNYGFSFYEFEIYGGELKPVAPPAPVGDPLTTAWSSSGQNYGYANWTNGLLAGNGKQAIIVLGNPRSEQIVFNDKEFFTARTQSQPHRSFNQISDATLASIKDQAVSGQYSTAASTAGNAIGWNGGGEGDKHPGFKLTVDLPDSGAISNYRRSTDYLNGLVKVNWTDALGNWERTSFVSRVDGVSCERAKPTDCAEGAGGVTVNYLPAPQGETMNVTLGAELDAEMHLTGFTSANASTVDYLDLRVKYPSNSYDASYQGVTRIVTDGQRAMSGDKVAVTGASYVLLLTKTQRYYGNFDGSRAYVDPGDPDHIDQNYVNPWGTEGADATFARNMLQQHLAGIGTDYAALLNAHVANHSEIMGRVMIDLGASEADRAKSNEQLIAAQKTLTGTALEAAMMERVYYNGRYLLLASSGEHQAPDLLGNWTGDRNVGWQGFYHLDANLNLQVASGNIGNMPEAMAGYFWLNEQWQRDFQTNASRLLGTRGMVTGGNGPGPEGLISSIGASYPYEYVTGGESWLLYPFWEYYLISGDKQFLADHYYKLVRDMGDFYEDFLTAKDADGKYILAGSISPETKLNTIQVNSNYDVSGARFALSTLIQTAQLLGKDTGKIATWQELLDNLPPYLIDDNGALSEWAWPDLADGSDQTYTHRHSSGMLPVWPYKEITPEKNTSLYSAAREFLSRKDGGNYENAGHGLLHGALNAANLNNAESVAAKLSRFVKDNYYYTSLGTAHYNTVTPGVFCTDVAEAVPAILMNMLATTDVNGAGEVTLEVLPALPSSLPSGSISGMLGKGQLAIDKLSWDTGGKSVEVTLTSKVNQDVTLIERAGISSATSAEIAVRESSLGDIAKVLPLKAGESATVVLELADTPEVPEANLALNKPALASSESTEGSGNERQAVFANDGLGSTRWASGNSNNQWWQVDLGNGEQKLYDVSQVVIKWEDSHAATFRIDYSADGANWTQGEVLTTSVAAGAGTDTIDLTGVTARFLRMQGLTRVNEWGYSIFEFEAYGAEATTPVVDASALEAAVDQAGELNPAGYTTSSWAGLQAVIADAEDALADAALTQDRVDALTAAVMDALDALDERGDVTLLLAVVAALDTLDSSVYTAESAAGLDGALNAAKLVAADNSDASQAGVDSLVARLQQAVAGLEALPNGGGGSGPADNTSLQAILEVASALDGDDYTVASFALVSAKLQAAQAVLQDSAATQTRIDAAYSALSGAVSALVPASKTPFKKVGTPTISGTAKVGKTLTAKPGTWSPKATSYTYQWFRGDQKIPGATKAKYTLTAADLGQKVSVKARGHKLDYAESWSHQSKTKKIAAGALSVKTPKITNVSTGKDPAKSAPKYGQTLQASLGAWGPAGVDLSLQWYRSGKAISGATSDSYTLDAADIGKTFKVKVTGKLAGYKTASKTSKASKKAVALSFTATAQPSITGIAQLGQRLSANPGVWSPLPDTLTYQWYRSGKAIKKATNAWYDVVGADKGKKLTVKVTAKKSGYKQASRTSAKTATVKTG
ncbi:MAG: discoidin domain-containing protein [Propionibacteriaceae bacterium]|nr:discoidin domain-containing protein [Propionibacteriaceae bacterium]